MTTEPPELDVFIRLSEVLLDASGLSRSAAAEVYAIVVAAAPARYGIDGSQPPMTALLATFAEQEALGAEGLADRLVSVLYADGTLGPMAKNLIITWYNGGLGLAVLSPANYGAALVWPVISAQPPGLPGPYYGSWAYPPPNLVTEPAVAAAAASDGAAMAAPVQVSATLRTPAEETS
ncbi:MAG TPA: sugar dehydrogenase complex small subunit [Jatrophihabitans sp.]|nr:sugar dehydrogenase complex small subunit [Jatrophihabitans sp.]